MPPVTYTLIHEPPGAANQPIIIRCNTCGIVLSTLLQEQHTQLWWTALTTNP